MSQTMPRIMTLEEIEAEFDSEWVLINEPEVRENLTIIRGEVIWHGKDRDELDRKIGEIPGLWSLAVWYTGQPPEGMEFIL